MDLADQVGRRHRAALVGEGLRRARARQAGGRPAGDDSGARVRAVGLQTVAPVHEDGAGSGQEVALASAPETTKERLFKSSCK